MQLPFKPFPYQIRGIAFLLLGVLLGSFVFASNLPTPGTALIFNGLARLRTGDLITVVGGDGTRRDFAVQSTASWPADSHPTGLFETGGSPRLSLITCGGAYFTNTQTYADRLVVEASLSGKAG